jgi:hypothetical protein
MTTKLSYFPKSESDQVPWCTNFRNKIGTHGPTCGIAAAEITDTQADLDFYVFLLNAWHPALQDALKRGTKYKTQVATGSGPLLPLPVPPPVPTPAPPPLPNPNPGGGGTPAPATFVRPPGVLTRLFNLIRRIKLAPGYTEGIGTDLRIVGVEDTTEHPVPEFTLKVQQGTAGQIVRIDFTKHGHTGVYIESRRGTGSWEFLAIDTAKPYLDERLLAAPSTAETREYRLRWWDDEPNGEWSPVQKITVGTG